jgi:IS5 family transposase
VRVLSRLANQAGEIFGTAFEDHSRIAKRRAIAIHNSRTPEQRLELYKDLVKVTSGARADALRVAAELVDSKAKMDVFDQLAAEGLCAEIEQYAELTKQVIWQTERRVMLGESLPPSQKIVSIFEPHTDIIKKDRR